jgi:hypothetical protein
VIEARAARVRQHGGALGGACAALEDAWFGASAGAVSGERTTPIRRTAKGPTPPIRLRVSHETLPESSPLSPAERPQDGETRCWSGFPGNHA